MRDWRTTGTPARELPPHSFHGCPGPGHGADVHWLPILGGRRRSAFTQRRQHPAGNPETDFPASKEDLTY